MIGGKQTNQVKRHNDNSIFFALLFHRKFLMIGVNEYLHNNNIKDVVCRIPYQFSIFKDVGVDTPARSRWKI